MLKVNPTFSERFIAVPLSHQLTFIRFTPFQLHLRTWFTKFRSGTLKVHDKRILAIFFTKA
jgi:hypothetical protein